MRKLFVPYELAVKLKEKGFDEMSLAKYYLQDEEVFLMIGDKEIEEAENGGDGIAFECNAPLFQQVVDWFREKHGIDFSSLKLKDGYTVVVVDKTETGWRSKSLPYYEALTKAIEESLRLI